MMSAGPFRRAAIAFSVSKSKSSANDGKIPDQQLTQVVSSVQNANSGQQPPQDKKQRNHSTTTPTAKPNKSMFFLPPIPFTAGSWSLKEENVLNIGQRIRRKRPGTKRDQEQPPITTTTNDGNDHGTDPIKPFSQTLQKAQGSVSRLWKKKSHLPAVPLTTVSMLSQMTTCNDDLEITKDILHVTRAEPVLSQSMKEESTRACRTSSSSSSSIPMRLFNQFRKRKVDRRYTCLSETEDREENLFLSCHDDDIEFESLAITPVSTTSSIHYEAMESKPSPDSKSQSPPSLTTDSIFTEPDYDESVLDIDTTAGVQPSVADSSMAMDSSINLADEPLLQPWEPPLRKQRKPRKPRHGDDSVLIGMIITFDPTAELLNFGKEPQCIAKSFLCELQKNDEYQGCILGDCKEEEEPSADELPSFSELLGFHLDCFGPPPPIETAWDDEEPKFPFFMSTHHEEEEINFAFHHGLDDSDDVIVNIIDLPKEMTESYEEEIEIVFYPVDHVHWPEDEEEGVSQTSSTKHGSCDIDSQSHSSEGSALPLEWMVPKHSVKVVVTSGSLYFDPPEYDWFLPDHQDVELANHHTPLAMFGPLLDEKHRNSITPSTVGETLSFDVQTSFDGSERSGVLSSGSLPSEAVQSLVDFCHLTMSDTCHGEYLHHSEGLFPSMTPSISI